MEVDDAIKNIKMFHFKNLPRFKPELIELLKSLEAENKALKILKQAQKDEDKKECIRYQTMYRLKRENKKLKKENKAYKGMWKELKPTDNYECLILEERHLLSKMGNLENKYLGGEMIIRYDIKPKSDNEYKDVIDGISDFLDRNNITHTKTEIEEKEKPPMRDPIKKRR